MSVTAALLATDRGEGFTESRFTAIVNGARLLDGIVSDALAWPVDDVIVVLGADADEIEAACDLSRVSILVDPEWSEGAAAPVRAVLDYVSNDRSVRSVLFARGDQPGIDAAVVAQVLQAAEPAGIEAAYPKYRYAKGWPIAIGRPLWDVFLGLEGAIDLHDVIASHGHVVDEVWVDRLSPKSYGSAEDLPSPRREPGHRTGRCE